MLITTIAQFRQIVPINQLTQFATLQPYLEEAELRHIRPMLGNELYNELIAATTPSDDQKVLLSYLRSSLANLAIYAGFDMLNVQFDETGFSRSNGDKTLYRYQEENIKGMCRDKGFDFFDLAFDFLYSKIDVFDKFKTSTWYINQQNSFFPTTATFNDICKIGNSRLVFQKIAGYFERVIDFEIIPALGRPLYDKVKAEMVKTTEVNADLMALVPFIRKPLAFLAVHAGINELNYNITNKGIVVEQQTAIGNSHITTSVVDNQVMEMMRKATKSSGDSYLNMLVTYLSDNRIKYPDYVQNITTTNPYRRDNTGKKTAWL